MAKILTLDDAANALIDASNSFEHVREWARAGGIEGYTDKVSASDRAEFKAALKARYIATRHKTEVKLYTEAGTKDVAEWKGSPDLHSAALKIRQTVATQCSRFFAVAKKATGPKAKSDKANSDKSEAKVKKVTKAAMHEAALLLVKGNEVDAGVIEFLIAKCLPDLRSLAAARMPKN